VGSAGVLISFVLALIIGGVAGYFGGWVDTVLQMLMDTVKTVPTIPLFMAVAAFIPDTWSAEQRFFFISLILGLLGWGTLARRIRTHVLAERSAGLRAGRAAVRRRARPCDPPPPPAQSFTSYIIVDLVISFPYMVLAETALSFIGLGLKDPVNSLGVMLQNVTRVDVMLNYQWYFIPVPIFVVPSSWPSSSWATGCAMRPTPIRSAEMMGRLLTVLRPDAAVFHRRGAGDCGRWREFRHRPGRGAGLVGESGSGKSVTAKSLMRLNAGNARYGEGSSRILLNAGGARSTSWPRGPRTAHEGRGDKISMIFQEPMASFAPAMTIGNQMVEQLTLHRGVDQGRREDAVDRDAGTRRHFRGLRSASTNTRSNCRAACGSAR
jgi:ABC-type multidrug transport system fused ATPase/permease subunit